MKNETVTHPKWLVFTKRLFLVLAFWLIAQPTSAEKKVVVDLALILAVDVSYSVDSTEFDLQMRGLSRAFSNPELLDAIKRCRLGRIAVMVVQWSGQRSQDIVVPWTIVGNSDATQRVAGLILRAPRRSAERTSISALINFGVAQHLHSPFAALRQIIDISGDGVSNDGELPRPARNRAIAAGTTINGLTILNEVANLDVYFKNYIVGGPNSFVMVANDYIAYLRAIKRKVLREVQCLAVS